MSDLRAYYDTSYPPSLWLVVSGVVLGSPGSFTPASADIPADLAALNALGSLGQTTPWNVADYIVLGDDSEATWNGVAWVVRVVTEPEPEEPDETEPEPQRFEAIPVTPTPVEPEPVPPYDPDNPDVPQPDDQ